MRSKKSKRVQYVVTAVLVIAAVLALGLLAFSGLFIIYASIPLAIVAFILSGLIEGQILSRSIFKAFSRLKLIGPRAHKHLFVIEFEKYLEQQDLDTSSACDFLKDYHKLLRDYKKTKAEETEQCLESTKSEAMRKRLEELREFFFIQTLQGKHNDNNKYVDGVSQEHAKVILDIAKRDVLFLRFFLVIAVLVGVGSGFVTASAISAALPIIGLSLCGAALCATVWPLAICAAIAATFLFYYVVTDIVKHDVIDKGLKSIGVLFKRKVVDGDQKEKLWIYVFRLAALTLLIVGLAALMVFATVATAGTWWLALKAGILLIPRVPIVFVMVIRAVLVPINFATDILFSIGTTLQTLENFKGLLTPVRYAKQCFDHIAKAFSKLRAKETVGQLCNIPRIVTKLIILPFKGLIFLGHLISIGLATDRLSTLPPLLVAVLCATAEGVQDASFLTEADDHDHSHHHSHGSYLIVPLELALSILLLPSALWHYCCRGKESPLTFLEALKDNFPEITHLVEDVKRLFSSRKPAYNEASPPLSQTWEKCERPKWFLSQAIARLESANISPARAKEKQQCLQKLISDHEIIVQHIQKEMMEEKCTSEVAIKNYLQEKTEKEEISPYDVLNYHRTLFSKCCFFNSQQGETTTMRLVLEGFACACPTVTTG